MPVIGFAPQLRTTDLNSTLRFYTEKIGCTVEFRFEDFYAGVRCGSQLIHLKQISDRDPSIDYVDGGGHLHLYFEIAGLTEFANKLRSLGVPIVTDVHETAWQTREFVIHDDQGHTLYFGEAI